MQGHTPLPKRGSGQIWTLNEAGQSYGARPGNFPGLPGGSSDFKQRGSVVSLPKNGSSNRESSGVELQVRVVVRPCFRKGSQSNTEKQHGSHRKPRECIKGVSCKGRFIHLTQCPTRREQALKTKAILNLSSIRALVCYSHGFQLEDKKQGVAGRGQ